MNQEYHDWGLNGQQLDAQTVGTADKQILGVDPQRVSVTLYCPGQQVWVRFKDAMTGAMQGIPVSSSGPPTVLHRKELGALVTNELHALGIAAGCTLIVIVSRH